MAAKCRGYELDVAQRGTRETRALNSAPSTVTRAEYDAVSEYACALEVENAELKSGRGDNVARISTL